MRWLLLLASLSLGVALSQAPPSSPASIIGVVRIEGTGQPMVGARVTALGPSRKETTTDGNGGYELTSLEPGAYQLLFAGPSSLSTQSRSIAVKPGERIRVEVELRSAVISGKVLDEDGGPVAGMEVLLVEHVYEFGEASYLMRERTQTDDTGAYRLREAAPGRSYLISARPISTLKVTSVAAARDPEKRRRVFAATVYPNSPSLIGGTPVKLRPGETRAGVDLHMRKSVPYCIEGGVQWAGLARSALQMKERQPRNAAGLSIELNSDSKFRACGIPAGEYVLSFEQARESAEAMLGAVAVNIRDKDVRDIVMAGRPSGALRGRVEWSGDPPERPGRVTARISLQYVSAAYGTTPDLDASPIPRDLKFRGPVRGECRVNVALPVGFYVKDIRFGEVSILDGVLRPDTVMPELRVFVARDGGTIAATVTGPDGNLANRGYVTVFPAAARTDAEIAEKAISGRVTPSGAYTSTTLRPGQYRVLVTDEPFGKDVETVGKFGRARASAVLVDVRPNAAAQIQLRLTSLN
jgi:hypothetical protein